MLAISVEFLFDGRYYARDISDERIAEWPPHPARLFAALVSAAAETQSLDGFRRLLRWLEEQNPPPDIAASSDVVPRVAWIKPNRLRLGTPSPDAYVRINDPENKSGSKAHPVPALRSLQKRFFPSVLAHDIATTFVWPHAEPTPEQRAELEELCTRVGYLGSSRSKVRVSLTDSPPAATWVHDPSSSEYLRVARQGTLGELESTYMMMQQELDTPGNRSYPIVGTEAGYRRVGQEMDEEPPVRASIFSSFLIFQLLGPRLHLESTLFLTQKIRGELLRGAGDELLPGIHGHHGEDHLALVPLAFVGTSHADGTVKGIGALIPESLQVEERDKILFRLAQVRSFEEPNLGHWKLDEPSKRKSLIDTLQRDRWTAESNSWATITPYVFDRYPKSNHHPADIIAASCERVGIGRPSRITLSEHSPLQGVPRSRDFQVRRPGKPPSKPYAHLTLTFSHRVRGPVVIGEKRYFGFGFCVPVEREIVPSAATVYELT